jgi:predicted RNase H-like HicB family nuclease
MAGYVALIHKDPGTSYGVSFPDVPGCISAGDTMEQALANAAEALANAAEALAGHLALMRADGDKMPKARGLRAIKADPELADELEGAIVKTVAPAIFVAEAK